MQDHGSHSVVLVGSKYLSLPNQVYMGYAHVFVSKLQAKTGSEYEALGLDRFIGGWRVYAGVWGDQ